MWVACIQRAALWAALPAVLGAQSATQVVRFEVRAVREIALQGEPEPILLDLTRAGAAPVSTARGGTYAITTNEPSQKITASLDAPMPRGLALQVRLAPPPGAADAGHVELSPVAADIVTGIEPVAVTGLPIVYRLTASAAPGGTLRSERRVTFTLVAGT